jgi:putative flippase GtrA
MWHMPSGILQHIQTTAQRSLPPGIRQFVKFGISGTFGFTVDMGTYLILTRLVGWTTVLTVFGYQFIAPNLVSVLAAMIGVFLLSKYWTFRDPRPEELARQGIRFFTLYATSYVLNQIVTSFFAFHVPALQSLFGSRVDVAAKVLAIGIILFVNFFGSKFLVFRRGSPTPVEAVVEGPER